MALKYWPKVIAIGDMYENAKIPFGRRTRSDSFTRTSRSALVRMWYIEPSEMTASKLSFPNADRRCALEQ